MTKNHNKTQLPHGSWPSPITTQVIVKDAIAIDELQVQDNIAYWIEKRPLESGRCVIVRYHLGTITDCLPKNYSSRSRVHEYGGASYIVTNHTLYFVNNDDQQIYQLTISNEGTSKTPKKLTHKNSFRFSNMVFDNKNQQLIAISEDHSSKDNEPKNTLVSINITNGNLSVLHEGYSFYSNPVINHSNQQLAWLCWNHPNMPWDGTELWQADLSCSKISHAQQIAGSNNISICQPRWSPAGILTYISDESNWWNLYQYKNKKQVCLYQSETEFGYPQWVFGQSSYQFVNENTIHCINSTNTTDSLNCLTIDQSQLTAIDTSLTTLSSLQLADNNTWLISSSSTTPPQITRIDHSGEIHVIKTSYGVDVDPDYLSIGENIVFTTRNDDTAFAIYYPPNNKNYTDTEKPPLIILSHGGPTGCSSNAFDMRKQYWTSRGFAIIDVNYSGSTGFGRNYRERLTKNWGIRDVDDCCDAALFAVDKGLADPDQLIIKGGSAGGYSVLCALTFHNVFSAGASYYGIGELETMTSDTHKFESRYLDKLIGPYPEDKHIYQERSPIHHVDQLNCPVIFFQGEDDFVVPKQQAETMVNAIDAKGLPVAYLLFEGEGHGFRKAQTIIDTLNAEYYFYSQIFKFDISEPITPIEIKNLGV